MPTLKLPRALPGPAEPLAPEPPFPPTLLLGRRQFLKGLGVVLAALAAPATGVRRAYAAARGRFFTGREFATLSALCDRVIPPDQDPGARALGAARYIERMLTAFDHRVPLVFAGGPFSNRNPFPDNDDGTPSPRRHLHRPPHPAHARGLLRAARVRRQPPAARLDDARPRGRRPAARLLDLLAREGRLQRAPRPSHVDAQPGRGERAATDQRRRQQCPGHDHRLHPHLRNRLSMARRKPEDEVLGNHGLARFDFCIIGSGAGGGPAAHVLTAAGKNVLVLEAGPNPFPGLDDPSGLPLPLHSNDELKYSIRNFVQQDPFLEPRTFRGDAMSAAAVNSDVNLLPKAVGGAFQHADAKTPRFNALDFRLKSTIDALITATSGLHVPGFDVEPANFADWPFTYADLEPFYVEAERLYGVQGRRATTSSSRRAASPTPCRPGVPMYFALLLADGARQVTLPGSGALNPHPYPAAINSRFYYERPPCVDCAPCCGFGW